MRRRPMMTGLATVGVASGISRRARAADPGITGTEIVFDQTAPYSGPASAYGGLWRVQAAYMRMPTERGGPMDSGAFPVVRISRH